jgi:hypothetical protein
MSRDYSKENAETEKKWPIGCRISYKGKDLGVVTGHKFVKVPRSGHQHLEVVGVWDASCQHFQFTPRSKHFKPINEILGLGPRFVLKDVGKPFLELWHKSGRFIANVHYNTPNIVPFDGATYLIETPWSSSDGEYHFHAIVHLGKVEVYSTDLENSEFVSSKHVNAELFDPAPETRSARHG